MDVPDRNDYHAYPRAERPDVEVLVDDAWQPGEAVARWRTDAGDLWYWVNVRSPGTHTRGQADFPASDVRLDQIDRAAGREVTGGPAPASPLQGPGSGGQAASSAAARIDDIDTSV